MLLERVGKLKERMILNIGIGQGVGRLNDVFRAGAVLPAGIQDDLQGFFKREIFGVSVVLSVHDEGQGAYGTFFCFAGGPRWNVGTGHHFAFPQRAKFLFEGIGSQSEHLAFTFAAFVQSEDKARAFGCAAVNAGPEAKGAVITMEGCQTAFQKFEFRAPDQGAVSKNPDVFRIDAGEVLLHGAFYFFVGPQAELTDMVQRFL